MVMEVVHEDTGGDGNVQCANHPYRNTSPPGGICALCLQEKLGKLVSSSSSFPVHVFPANSSSSASSSPSFRSRNAQRSSLVFGSSSSSSSAAAVGGADSSSGYCRTSTRSRLPFILTTNKRKKKKKKKDGASASDSTGVIFKRSKSTTTPRTGAHYFDGGAGEDYSPQRRGFFRSFLYLSKHYPTAKRSHKSSKDLNFTPTRPRTVTTSRCREDENASSPEKSSFDRKVSRSRSVGCGSRSFSGDFFERISTGLGDCTLRRVESQREGKHSKARASLNGHERVRCGGIFRGFMITSSSSLASNWAPTLADDVSNAVSVKPVRSHLSHERSRSWGWALASPMRAFAKASSSAVKRDSVNSNKNLTPNLAAIPSLLTVSG